MRSCLLWGLLFLLGTAAAQDAIDIPPATAHEHLRKKVDPKYPAIARAACVEGNVQLQFIVSPDGRVQNVKVISGPALLMRAAIDAAQQWEYEPFVVDGHAVAVNVQVEMAFSITTGEGQDAVSTYYKSEDQCWQAVRSQQYANAESVCKNSIQLADQLPAERQLERMEAYKLTGYAVWSQRRFPEALDLYLRELAIAKAVLKAGDADLGLAYHDIALGLQGVGRFAEARAYYRQSEGTLARAREDSPSESLKNKYSGYLQSALRDYAALLRQVGEITAADAAESKASSIVVKTGLKDEPPLPAQQ